MFDLTGKSALVTAAGQGIGRASAIALARAGAKVYATDLNERTLGSLGAEDDKINTFRLDVLSSGEIENALSRTGPVDILFNCAGRVDSGSILDCKPETLDGAYALNVMSAFRMIRTYLPGMRGRQSGSIINMASVSSSVKGSPNRFAYGTTKAALIGLTKSVAADFIREGIRCNAICAGTVESPSLGERLRAQGDYEATRSAFLARQPIGRFGKPEEIAALVVYLASDEAAFTTGQIHVIDGGQTN